jgi:hypothetical protein
VFQQGGGEERLVIKSNAKYEGTIDMLAGDVGDFLANVLGVTWSSAGYLAHPLHFDSYPKFSLESVCRRQDNSTHLVSKCFQDCILREFNFGSPNEMEVVSVPFYSYHDPFLLKSGYHMVYDVFSGTGSTVEFTLTSTAVKLTNVALEAHSDWVLDSMAFCKVKLTADSTGTRQKSGITFGTNKITFTTAPAASSRVEVWYAVAN